MAKYKGTRDEILAQLKVKPFMQEVKYPVGRPPKPTPPPTEESTTPASE